MINQPDRFRYALECFKELEAGWDGYDAPALAETTIYKADQFLIYLSEQYPNLKPSRIAPSVDGSIVISFLADKIRTNIEFFDDIILAVIAKDGQSPDVWEVKDVDQTIDKIIAALLSAYKDE